MFEKSIEHTVIPVSPFAPPENFRDISPLGRIPVLQDENYYLPDSSAICHYLERKQLNPTIYPEDDQAYGKALFIEEYADTEFAAQVGLGVFRPLLIGPLMGKSPDLDKAKKTIAEILPRHFAYFESIIGSKTFIVGNQLSIADISVAVQIQGLALCGYHLPKSDYPQLAAHFEMLSSRESFGNAIKPAKLILESVNAKPFDLT